MFDEIFGHEAIAFLLKLEEEQHIIIAFRKELHKKWDYKSLVKLGMIWSTMTEEGQCRVAIRRHGDNYASIFMKYMDYLAEKIKMGDVKL